jgi:GNAT superfamily N-acetyltransferase
VSGTINPLSILYAGDQTGQRPNALAPVQAISRDAAPTPADAWEYNAPVVADAARQAQNPEFWREAAQQYGNALLMGSTTPVGGIRLAPNGVIMRGSDAVGKVNFEHGDAFTRIGSIEVNPSHQNQGIGSSVIRQIQDEAAQRNNPVVLTTDAFRGKDAQSAQLRLYQRLGFQPNKGPDQVYERIGGKKVAEDLVWHPPAPDAPQ